MPYLFPDQDFAERLLWTEEWPLLPVVSRAAVSELEDLATLPGIRQAHREALCQ